jgi:large subunit ribosomal protein L15
MDLSSAKAMGLKRERPKRLGRGPGSGTGKTSGKGHKGQKSRSGYKSRLGFEGGQMPLYRRLPRRGFNNKNFTKRYTIINVQDLDCFDEGTEVNLQAVLDKGLTSMDTPLLKVLGNGDLGRKLIVKADRFSASAKAKIEAAGGEVHVIPSKPRYLKPGNTPKKRNHKIG